MNDLEEAKDCAMKAMQRENKNPNFMYNMAMVEMDLLVLLYSILSMTDFVKGHL